jgi:predicted CXXCH cytochrome family protein
MNRRVWLAAAAIALGSAAVFFMTERPPPPSPATGSETVGTLAGYAGSASCRQCHAVEFNRWKDSHHALAERDVIPARDRPAFDPPRTIHHGTQTSQARLVRGRCELLTRGVDGKRQAFPLQRVIGVDPLRQFLVASDHGRFQVAELAYDPARRDWFDVFGNEDRQPGEWGHWTGRGMTWNVMCAACHNTGLKKNYHPASDTYTTAMAQRGVGCEACHGPMADHVAWERRHHPSAAPVGRNTTARTGGRPTSPTQPRPSVAANRNAPGANYHDPTRHPLSRDQALDTCGSCHARRAELTGGFSPGQSFLDNYLLTIPDETDLFYPDGQVHAEDYEYTAFLGSRMYAAGVRCVDCHEPHSGKTRAAGNALCLRCHQGQMPAAPKINPAAHSHHALDQPGGLCLNCHMPQTVYMQQHWRHDHGFTIPDPLLTRQFGIPNACNRCHKDHDAAWALAAVQTWYGARMDRPTRARAQTIARARAGQETAVEGLLRILRDDRIGLWRAVAAGLLKRWVTESKVQAALVAGTDDSNPLVRAAVAQGLAGASPGNGAAQRVLHGFLRDPVRAVRVEAAWALHGSIDTRSVAGVDLQRFLNWNQDEPSGAMQLGVYDLDRGDNADALALFRRAVAWDHASAPLRAALAVSLSVNGDTNGAVRELETACRLAPRDAEYRFKLGLALNEVGNADDALRALERAVQLDPRLARAWYDLGLAYAARQQPGPALAALVRAESIDPHSPEIPYARATILAGSGRLDEARAAARRALEIRPDFSAAAELLRRLEAAPIHDNAKP